MTIGVYVNDVTYGEGWFQRGHWSDRLAAIDKDIALMEQKAAEPAPGPRALSVTPDKVASLIRDVLGKSQRTAPDALHVPPEPFRRGQAVALQLALSGDQALPKAVRLFYRHTHQAQPWQVVPMKMKTGTYRAAIPEKYTDAPYPLEYYFEGSEASGRSWLYPGLGASLTDQPYFVLRPLRVAAIEKRGRR